MDKAIEKINAEMQKDPKNLYLEIIGQYIIGRCTEPAVAAAVEGGKTLDGAMKACAPRYGGNKYTADPSEFYRTKSGNAYKYRARRNKRDVWTVSTKPFSGAHFAVFPPEIVAPCILAGCPKNGVVLDPFIGSGTTAYVAKNFQRNFIGIDLNPKYCDMTEERTRRICDDLRRI